MNKKLLSQWPVIFCFCLILIIFRSWFKADTVSAGDLGFFFASNMAELKTLPFSWETFRNSGLGGVSLPFQHWYFSNLGIGLIGSLTNFPFAERVVWLWPIIGLAVLTTFSLAKSFGFMDPPVKLLLGLILFLNTYFLMIVSGGQITVAWGYAFLPFVFSIFYRLINQTKPKPSSIIVFSLLLSFLFAFDLRYGYLFLLLIALYFPFAFLNISFFKLLKKYLLILLPAGFIVLGIHCYWIIPLVLFPSPALPAGYESSGWVTFLSFADFSKTFSLLHPNWPEGIFGKTDFMKPEFLVYPLIGFASLLFFNARTNKETRKNVLFMSFLVLIGSFLAKGSKSPFGVIYLWFFEKFPGGSLFRDPTKFYLFSALGYSFLIPFFASKLTIKYKNILIFFLLAGFLFLIGPALTGDIGGILKPAPAPQNYLLFRDFVDKQPEFFRLLWLPTKQRYGFSSINHPAVSAQDFMTSSVCLPPFCDPELDFTVDNYDCSSNDRCFPEEASFLSNPEMSRILELTAIKYLVVPEDSEKEIFLADRKYSDSQRQKLINYLDSLDYLKKISVVNGIDVYEVAAVGDLFSGVGYHQPKVNWQRINPTKYIININDAQTPFNLVFSETFNPYWQAKTGDSTIKSRSYFNYFNSFYLQKTGDYRLVIEFAPQKYLYFGVIIGALTFLSCIGILIYNSKRK